MVSEKITVFDMKKWHLLSLFLFDRQNCGSNKRAAFPNGSAALIYFVSFSSLAKKSASFSFWKAEICASNPF